MDMKKFRYHYPFMGKQPKILKETLIRDSDSGEARLTVVLTKKQQANIPAVIYHWFQRDERCYHEHDCCGCVRTFAEYYKVRRNKRREYSFNINWIRNI